MTNQLPGLIPNCSSAHLALQLVVHALEQLTALLEVAAGAVGLLEVDDEDLNLGLEPGLLLFNLGQLGHQRLDVLLLLLDLQGELTPAESNRMLHVRNASYQHLIVHNEG